MNAKFFEWPWFFTKEKKRDKAPSCCQFQDCGKKLTFDNNYRCLCCGLILCVACKKSVTFGLPESKEEVDFFCFRCAEYVKKIDKQEKEKSSNYGLHSAFNNEKFTNILQSYPIKKEIVRDSSHGTSNFFGPIKAQFWSVSTLFPKRTKSSSAPDVERGAASGTLPASRCNSIAPRETMNPCAAAKESAPSNSVTRKWGDRFPDSPQRSSTLMKKKKPEENCIEDGSAEALCAERPSRDKQYKERKKIFLSDSEPMFLPSAAFVPTFSLGTSPSASSGFPDIPRLPLSPLPFDATAVEHDSTCASVFSPLSHGGDMVRLKGVEIGSRSTLTTETREQTSASHQEPTIASELKYARNHGDSTPFHSPFPPHHPSSKAENHKSPGFDPTKDTTSGSRKVAMTTTTRTYDNSIASANTPISVMNSPSSSYLPSTTMPERTSRALKGGVETNPQRLSTDGDRSSVDEKEYLLQWREQLEQKEKSISDFLTGLSERVQNTENYVQFLEKKLSEVITLHSSLVNELQRRMTIEEEVEREVLSEEEYH